MLLFQSEIQHGRHHTRPYGENMGNLGMNVPCMDPLQNLCFFGVDLKSKIAATAGHSLTLDPMGNTFKDLLLRNNKVNENDRLQKYYLDGPLQSLRVFFADLKSKMAATAGHSLTSDPMGNMYKKLFHRNYRVNENDRLQKYSLDGPLQSLGFFADPKSKMAATQGHSLTLDPMGNRYKDLLLKKRRVNENGHLQKCSLDGPLQSLCFFFSIRNPRWPSPQDIV